MKKILFIMALMLMSSVFAVSYTNISDGDSWFAGNLGIGSNYVDSDLGIELALQSGETFIQAYNRSGSSYGTLNINGDPIVINTGSGGDVGIGTTSPSAKLELFKDASPASSSDMALRTSGTFGGGFNLYDTLGSKAFGMWVTTDGDGALRFHLGGTDYGNNYGSVEGNLSLGTTSGFRVPIVYENTTASASNIYVDSNGQLFRSTSSRRYKTDIDYNNVFGELVYDMKPVSFKGTDGVSHVGFIAEDLAEVEPRLVKFDEEGRPDAIEYAYITALLVDEVKKLRNELCSYDSSFCNVSRGNEDVIFNMKLETYDENNVTYTEATETAGNWFTDLFNW